MWARTRTSDCLPRRGLAITFDHSAWWISDHPRPIPTSVFQSYYDNATGAEFQNSTTASNMTVIDMATSYHVWRALSSDIFTGQIIASVIVLAFLGVFLLREWIMQNARPGVFEEDDRVDPPVANVPAPAPANNNDGADLVAPPADGGAQAVPALPAEDSNTVVE